MNEQYESRRGGRGKWIPLEHTSLMNFLRGIELDINEPAEYLLECLDGGEVVVARGFEVRNAKYREEVI